MPTLIGVRMFNNIAAAFTVELRNRRSLRVIVSDSSEEEQDEVLDEEQNEVQEEVSVDIKRKRGRPRMSDIKRETIDLIDLIDLAVQSLTIEGLSYNKCIYTGDLYDKRGSLVGRYDKSSHSIKEIEGKKV